MIHTNSFLAPGIATAVLANGIHPQDPADAFFTAPENTLTVTELGPPFEMLWGHHPLEGRLIEKAFLIVPVTVEGIEQNLFMQFDLGSPTTVLYRAALESVIERGAELSLPSPGQA